MSARPEGRYGPMLKSKAAALAHYTAMAAQVRYVDPDDDDDDDGPVSHEYDGGPDRDDSRNTLDDEAAADRAGDRWERDRDERASQ